MIDMHQACPKHYMYKQIYNTHRGHYINMTPAQVLSGKSLKITIDLLLVWEPKQNTCSHLSNWQKEPKTVVCLGFFFGDDIYYPSYGPWSQKLNNQDSMESIQPGVSVA